ncbi:MAG: cyclic nucleotide-binding domain-containing protein [Anaerolineae bacterium]|nr:cyclic nucleotide-binding domain-containing protein [Anaerolineae bacterium]
MVELDALRHCELFADLSDKELGQLAAIVCEERHEPGSLICAERELADRLFVLSRGRVQLQIRLRGHLEPAGEATIEEVEPGRIFGWSSLVKQRRFTASARALDPVAVLSIRADDLRALFDQSPHIGFVVMKQLAEVVASRLQHTRQVCEEAAAEAALDDGRREG